MNKRLLTVLGFALVVSAVVSFLLYRVIVAQLSSAPPPSVSQVVTATHNLETGALIKDGDVKVAGWGASAPQGAILKLEDAIGRGVVEPIYEGEPVLESRVAPRGAGAGLAATIPNGMRAVAVRVNDVAGVGGFVTPGMRVDILIAGNPPGASNVGTQSKTLLQNIQVLSAGQNIQKDNEGKPVTVPIVNLLVTPEQAEVLSLASNETRIQLVLRNPADKDTVQTPGTAIAYLFGGRAAAPAPEPPKPAPRPAPKREPPPPPPLPPPPPVVVVKPPEPERRNIVVEVITGSRRAESKFQENAERPEGKQQ